MIDCEFDDSYYMSATSLRTCLTSLGANPSFREIEYIEIHPQYTSSRIFLEKICYNGKGLFYDQNKTEEQDKACTSGSGWMYPSYCDNNNVDSWLECEGKSEGCKNKYTNFNGFFCKGIPNITFFVISYN